MDTAKKRFKPAALSAATAVALIAGFLSVAPAASASAVTDYTQPCAEPTALNGADAQTHYDRVGNFGSDELASELVCFSTAGSNAQPGGTLNAQIRPIYAGTEISAPTVNWVDSNGSIVFSTAPSQDSTGGWTASLRLTERESGKNIHAELSDVSASLPLHYETSVPDLWDNLCLEELNPTPGTETPTAEPTDGTAPVPSEGTGESTAPQDVDKSICLVEAGHTELVDRVLQLQGAKFSGPEQTVAYVPVQLGAVSISGTALVTSTLNSKVAAGTKAKSVTYQWLRSGVAIPKATGSSYKLVDADRGKLISLRVTATSPGQGTVVRDSNRTGQVIGKLSAPNPKVSLVNGRISCPQWNCTATMQVKATVDKGATAKYQWYRDGKAIKGATKSTYAVKFKYKKGLKYTVKYTAQVSVSRAGFRTETQSSTSTASAWVKLPK